MLCHMLAWWPKQNHDYLPKLSAIIVTPQGYFLNEYKIRGYNWTEYGKDQGLQISSYNPDSTQLYSIESGINTKNSNQLPISGWHGFTRFAYWHRQGWTCDKFSSKTKNPAAPITSSLKLVSSSALSAKLTQGYTTHMTGGSQMTGRY